MHQLILSLLVRNKSGFVERFPELSLFYRLFSPLDSEMICIIHRIPNPASSHCTGDRNWCRCQYLDFKTGWKRRNKGATPYYKIQSFFFIPLLGFQQVLLPLFSYHYGANNNRTNYVTSTIRSNKLNNSSQTRCCKCVCL